MCTPYILLFMYNNVFCLVLSILYNLQHYSISAAVNGNAINQMKMQIILPCYKGPSILLKLLPPASARYQGFYLSTANSSCTNIILLLWRISGQNELHLFVRWLSDSDIIHLALIIPPIRS